MKIEERGRLQKLLIELGTVLLAGVAYLLLVRITGWGIPCLFNATTGLLCPGCGISRMFVALSKLDIAGAFRSNCLVLTVLAVGSPMVIRYWVRYVKTGSRELDIAEKILLTVTAVLAVAFWILRNLEPFAFLAPN